MRTYPKFKFFRNGKPVDYNGGFNAEDILKWIEEKTCPTARTLTTAEEVQSLKSSANVVVVGLFSDLESDDAKTFLEAADDYDEYPFAISSEKAVFAELGADKDGVVLLKKFDEGRNELDEPVSVEAIKKIVDKYRVIVTWSKNLGYHMQQTRIDIGRFFGEQAEQSR